MDGTYRAAVFIGQLSIRLLAAYIFTPEVARCQLLAAIEMTSTSNANESLLPISGAILLNKRAGTMKALFLFITFEVLQT